MRQGAVAVSAVRTFVSPVIVPLTLPAEPVESAAANLLALLLRDQQDLTAVERFAQRRDASAPERRYAALLPAERPATGQQYAFEVDLDRCSGCKACVTACHSLNGLDDGETWRDVGLLVGGTTADPFVQHVTTACHHCLEPACLAACPVNAYEKDPATGIVRHLDDQCFGCQYCTLACPYDVPKYHARKGIVRKCDLCAGRLAVGEPSACAAACPHAAIAIRVVEVRQVVENAEANLFLPSAPEPHLTLPTTRYKSRRPFPPNTLPADYYCVWPQHAHGPLVVMLVLTQLSVGAFGTGLVLESVVGPAAAASLRPLHAACALVFGLVALAASTLHLGRPRYAFRAVLGLRHSWLSREIVAFGLFATLAALDAAATGRADPLRPAWWASALSASVVAAGLAGVVCSAMVYAVTRRALWRLPATLTRFALTTALLGVAALWLPLVVRQATGSGGATGEAVEQLSRWLVALAAGKLLFDATVFRHRFDRRMTPLRRSALLMAGPLARITLARFACGLLGGLLLPLLLRSTAPESWGTAEVAAATVSFLACLGGELLERSLFFAAVASPRMPGRL